MYSTLVYQGRSSKNPNHFRNDVFNVLWLPYKIVLLYIIELLQVLRMHGQNKLRWTLHLKLKQASELTSLYVAISYFILMFYLSSNLKLLIVNIGVFVMIWCNIVTSTDYYKFDIIYINDYNIINVCIFFLVPNILKQQLSNPLLLKDSGKHWT